VGAYEEGLDAAEPSVLEDALKRNVFPEADPSAGDLKVLADYVRRAADGLSALPVAALLNGETAFAAPPEAVVEGSGA
jgi:cytochrome b pre-mRNA-processing protein 3